MRTPARRVTRRTMGLATAALVAMSTLVPWNATIGVTASAANVSKSSWKLGPGVKLTRIRYPNTPNEVRVLTILPQRGPRLDVVAAGPDFPMYKLTSGMAAGNGAIAGVNGDFATRYGAPSHNMMIDGELWNSASTGGPAFAVSHDGANAYIGIPKLRMEARVKNRNPQPLAEWNVGAPSMSSIHAYTRRGGTGVQPPGKVSPTATDAIYCAVRLTPASGYSWSNSQEALISRTYEVRAQECARTKMSLGSDAGNVVLASKGRDGTRSEWLRGLSNGRRVKLAYGFGGWPGVTDVIGGTPMLVRDGDNVAPRYTSGSDHLLWYNPRTSVGINRACVDDDRGTRCKIWVVTVDGRQSSWSKGMQLPRLAQEFLSLGARYAMNLDGGASTAMWVKRKRSAYCQTNPAVGGCLVSRPSASFGERVTISGLSVLPEADKNTPNSLR
jgi:Phosphodiester glycosidase